jgi:type IV secretory pathway VirB2 component (pilin)
MRQIMKRAEAKMTAAALAMIAAMPAQAAGLQKATSVINSLTSDVKTIIPLVAILALGCLALAWGLKWIRFLTLLQLGGGVLLAGSAAEIVAMLGS